MNFNNKDKHDKVTVSLSARAGAIVSGWKNYLSKSDVTEAVAKSRAFVCAACPHARQGKLLAFVKDTLKEVEGAYCDACGCPLSAKVRSTDICPNNKW